MILSKVKEEHSNLSINNIMLTINSYFSEGDVLWNRNGELWSALLRSSRKQHSLKPFDLTAEISLNRETEPEDSTDRL